MHQKSEFLVRHFLKRSPLDGGCFSSLRFTPCLETPLHNSKVSWPLPLHRFLRQPVNEINGRILREPQVRPADIRCAMEQALWMGVVPGTDLAIFVCREHKCFY